MANARPVAPRSLLLASVVLAAAGCGSAKKAGTGHPSTAPVGGPFGVSGVVRSQGNQLPGVTVTSRCGAQATPITADEFGNYTLDVPGSGCDRLVLTFEKEGFATVARTLPLPTSRSQIALDVSMAPLTELICGAFECSYEEGEIQGSTPSGEIARGWGAIFGGQKARESVPGEYFDTTGAPLLLITGHQVDYRDASGAKLAALQRPFTACYLLPAEVLDELSDLTPSATNPGATGLEAAVYELDVTTGRWRDTGRRGVASAGGVSDDVFYVAAYPESALGDLRRGAAPTLTVHTGVMNPPADAGAGAAPSDELELDEAYLCADEVQSGIFALGYPYKGKGCAVVDVVDDCGDPDGTATVEAFGRDRSFYTWGYTTPGGRACLTTPRSEAINESVLDNHVQGETFWVDLVVDSVSRVAVDALALPAADGTCAQPDTCAHVIVHNGQPCAAADDAATPATPTVDAGTASGEGTGEGGGEGSGDASIRLEPK